MLLEVKYADGGGQTKLLHNDSGADAVRWIEKDATDECLDHEHDDDCIRVGRYIHRAKSGKERPRCSAWWPPNAEQLMGDRPDQRCSQKSMNEQECCNHGVPFP